MLIVCPASGCDKSSFGLLLQSLSQLSAAARPRLCRMQRIQPQDSTRFHTSFMSSSPWRNTPPPSRVINSYGFTQRTHSHRHGSWHLMLGFHVPRVPLTSPASFGLDCLSLLEFGFLISVPPAEESSTGLLTS